MRVVDRKGPDHPDRTAEHLLLVEHVLVSQHGKMEGTEVRPVNSSWTTLWCKEPRCPPSTRPRLMLLFLSLSKDDQTISKMSSTGSYDHVVPMGLCDTYSIGYSFGADGPCDSHPDDVGLMRRESRPPMGFTINRWAFEKEPYTRENLRVKKQNSNK